MVESDASSLGGSTLRGFGGLLSRRQQLQHQPTNFVDPASDAVSVISNASTAKGSLFGKTIIVHSDSSSDDEDDDDTKAYPNEFVIQCKDDEMVFVTSDQGKKILKRCQVLRELVHGSCEQDKGQILDQPDWSAAHVRRFIEVSSTGSTWIENDASIFAEFLRAAREEVSMDIRLTSLINNQDILTRSSTESFFQMMHFENYQFKLCAAIKSSQWLQLLRMGILLMSKSKLLSVKLANYKSGKKNKKGCEGPSVDRLAKCDEIYSEFCVYAKGNMQAVMAVSSLLSPLAAIKKTKAPSSDQHVAGGDIKLIFKVPKGSLSHEELAMLWRMTDSTYTLSSKEEQVYLESFQTKTSTGFQENGSMNDSQEQQHSQRKREESSGPSSVDHHSEHSSADTSASTDAFSNVSIPNKIAINTTKVDHHERSAGLPCSYSAEDYHCRTLSGSSFLALKHLFDSINVDEPDLVACLVVQKPTPDTLGRLINATRATEIPRLDFDLQENVYFACKTSCDIKKMLAYMADYSRTAVIKGDFQLCQRIIM